MRRHQPKYRPSLTAEELQDCVTALTTSLPTSSALPTLQLYLARVQIQAASGNPTTSNHTTGAGLVSSPTPKPQLPVQLLGEFNTLYAEQFHKVATGQLTQEQLAAHIGEQLITKYPEHTNILANYFNIQRDTSNTSNTQSNITSGNSGNSTLTPDEL